MMDELEGDHPVLRIRAGAPESQLFEHIVL
jgi:hypothetical protein